jgi:hypothetical protein
MVVFEFCSCVVGEEGSVCIRVSGCSLEVLSIVDGWISEKGGMT